MSQARCIRWMKLCSQLVIPLYFQKIGRNKDYKLAGGHRKEADPQNSQLQYDQTSLNGSHIVGDEVAEYERSWIFSCCVSLALGFLYFIPNITLEVLEQSLRCGLITSAFNMLSVTCLDSGKTMLVSYFFNLCLAQWVSKFCNSKGLSSRNGRTGNVGSGELMKIKVAPLQISHHNLFHDVLILTFPLLFLFVLKAMVMIEGANKCSSIDTFDEYSFSLSAPMNS